MHRGLMGLALAAAMLISACANAGSSDKAIEMVATPEAAWTAWRSGEASDALAVAERLIGDPATVDEGHHIAVLAEHVRGSYDSAIAHYTAIMPGYARRRELRGVVFESYLHADRAPEALQFAVDSEMSPSSMARAQSRIDNRMAVTIPGVVGLAFENDALTPFMPGVAGHVNGQAAIFRFDTGGTFVAMSPALAARYGVRSAQCAEGFANLQATQVCHGVADLDLGPVRVVNAPVAVISSLPAAQLGVELGPVLGTNFLQRFLATIDAPKGLLLLSPRDNPAANAQHMALLTGPQIKAPFLLWADHFMIVRGGAGGRRDLNFFVDSGLVAVDADGVQAGLLVSQNEAARWAGVSDPSSAGSIVALASDLWLGAASQSGQRAMVLPDASWAAFGNFGGIGVNGLISYGYLKHYAWTLDFDRQEILLSAP